jgi:DNA-directed RNA polymerase
MTSTAQIADRIPANVERERLMADRGRRRAETMIRRAEERGNASETPAGTELVRRAVEPVSKAIADFVAAAYSGKAGRKAAAAKLLQGVDPDKAAYMAVKIALNGAMRQAVLKSVALDVSRNLEIELLGDAFETANKPLYKAVERRAKDKGLTPQRLAKAVELASRKFEIEREVWTYDEKLQLGTKLVELVIEHTGGLVKAPLVRLKKDRSTHVVSFGEGFGDWYDAFNASAALSRPMWLPTLAPPKPWETVRGGGYATDAIRAPSILSRAFPGQLALLKDTIMPDVYEGLNGIQETPWRVNERVFEVMAHAWEHGLPFPALPPRDDVPLPEKPEDIATNEAARKAYSEKAREAHQKNAELRSMRFAFSRVVEIARENLGQPIYFPHRLDFRGRCYAMSTALHPQGPDEARGLLTFAEGKPLGERGHFWLGVHGANLFGNDKVSLEERFNWALAHGSHAMRVAADPLSNQWWTEADKPWSFLAWCFEWAAMTELDDRTHNGTRRFVSHLPIALDGSCNGIQHYSAMLRDEVGGAAVNLVPSEKPQDIYQEVADRVKAKLVAAAKADETNYFAYQWHLFGIDRKITKRAVMVLPYGGTFKSCLDYVSDATNERFKAGQEQPFGDELRKAQGYLAKLVWESIGDVVIAARAAMKWLQDVSRVCTKAGVPIRWTTPTGFVAVQDYREVSGRLIETRFMGKMMKYRSTEKTDRIDGDKQASALPPNVVHSLDASAMMRTIVAAKAEGITSFAMIHDSYGTHAADTERFSKILRESFVAMYSETDFLEHFRDEIAAQLPPEAAAKLPPLPAKGSLELSDVLNSRYFFA